MLFWLTVIAIVLLLSFILKVKYHFIIWLFLALLGAFRYRVGTDYVTYENIFNNISTGGEELLLEIGYYYLIELVSSMGGNAQMLFFLTFTLTTYLYYNSFRYYMKYINHKSYMLIVLFIFLFLLYFFSLTIVRQALAIAIFFYATRYIIEKKPIYYFILILVATTIHFSVFIMLPLYYIIMKKFSKKFIFLFLIISFLFLIINPLDYIYIILSSFGIPYARFFETTLYSDVLSSQFKIILTITTTIFILVFMNFLNRDNKLENMTFNFMLFFILIRMIAIHMDVFNRLSNGFKPFIILFIIFIIIKMINKYIKAKSLIIVSSITLLVMISIIVTIERSSRNGSFNHYAMNLSLMGKDKHIVQVYGNHEDYKKGIEK